jgi:E3 ubiquitin-protein ligase TRIP12
VTRANVDRYDCLVNEFTVGETFTKIVQRFRDGFHAVIEEGLWGIFTPAEMARIISGVAVAWTRAELEAHVKFEHGYDQQSPERQMLFDTLMGFEDRDKARFLKFLTGCERLPTGGLAALHPKLTVARRVTNPGEDPNESLPTAATCSNYFKLPPYTDHSIMVQKIVMAIMEGQDEFGLS